MARQPRGKFKAQQMSIEDRVRVVKLLADGMRPYRVAYELGLRLCDVKAAAVLDAVALAERKEGLARRCA